MNGKNNIEFVNLIEWANLFRCGRSIVMGMHNAMLDARFRCLVHPHLINTYCIEKKKKKRTIITEIYACECVFQGGI